jgi:hypothetical protein
MCALSPVQDDANKINLKKCKYMEMYRDFAFASRLRVKDSLVDRQSDSKWDQKLQCM